MKRIVLLLASVAGWAYLSWPAHADDDDAAKAASSVLVQTAPLERGSLPRTIILYGTAQPNPTARNSVMAPVAATVADVYARVGQIVAKGDPLVQLAPTPQTKAAYGAAVSSLRVESDALTRTRQLREEYLATDSQVVAAEKAETDAREALSALRAQGAEGPTTLRAPAAGVVTAVTADRRAIVAEGAPLLELAQSSGLVLIAGAVPSDAAMITAGNAASIRAVGRPKSIPCKVTMRGGAVDPANGLVPVEISLPPGALMPGEAVEAAVTTGQVTGYVVPHESVLVNDTGDNYVVQDVDGVANIVPVTVLLSTGEKDVIDGKLADDPLILGGAHQLQDGMKVRFSDVAEDSDAADGDSKPAAKDAKAAAKDAKPAAKDSKAAAEDSKAVAKDEK